jgi:hypothetical protein
MRAEAIQCARNPLRLPHDALQRAVGEDLAVVAGHLRQTMVNIRDALLSG